MLPLPGKRGLPPERTIGLHLGVRANIRPAWTDTAKANAEGRHQVERTRRCPFCAFRKPLDPKPVRRRALARWICQPSINPHCHDQQLLSQPRQAIDASISFYPAMKVHQYARLRWIHQPPKGAFTISSAGLRRTRLTHRSRRYAPVTWHQSCAQLDPPMRKRNLGSPVG